MEKVDGEFAPYAIVEHYGKIENKLSLNVNCTSGERSVRAAFRHYFCCFLYLTLGILRGESVYQADLLDLQGITMSSNSEDLYPLYIMIMQIPFVRTNRGFICYRRSTRYRDVCVCCIGGLALSLNFYFFVTREFSRFVNPRHVFEWTSL